MGKDEIATSRDESNVLAQWTARKLRPIVVLYVGAVFAAFAVLSYFVFHSITGVKALAIGAVGAVVSLVPALLVRQQYRMTDAGLHRRTANERTPRQFTSLFTWNELSHVVVKPHGFIFYKAVDEPRRLRRFWKKHISDAHSGEVHTENEDRDRILGILSERGIRGAGGQRSA